MNLSVVWLDLEQAKVFHLSEVSMERETFREPTAEVPAEPPTMYAKIADRLARAKRVLILGPGAAKKNFHTFLTTHFPNVAKRVVACESSDHPSDAQIAAFAAKFLQKPVG